MPKSCAFRYAEGKCRRGFVRAAFAFWVLSALGSEAHAGFAYRKRITVDAAKVAGSTDFADFPVLISLVDADLATVASGGKVETGFDIVFRDADGLTSLDFEVEKYDPVSGTLVAWVRLPTLFHDVGTSLYLHYGDPSVVSSQENAPWVWSGDFEAVWHLHDDFLDSRGAHDGTNNGSLDAPGKIADAQDFDGASHNISVSGLLGASTSLLVVAHTERDDTIRMISARPMTRRERKFYEEDKRD